MSTAAPQDDRPGFAVLCGELTPYRVHLHERLVREIPELRLWTLQTWDSTRSVWTLGDHDSINRVGLAPEPGRHSRWRLGRALDRWRTARATKRWLETHRVAAVLVLGYAELSRFYAIAWGRRRGVPTLLWGDSNIRADTSTGIRRKIKHLIVPRILRRCAGAVACGSLGRAFFRRYGVPDDRIFISPYEPDYGLLEGVSAHAVDEARRRFSLDPARFRMVVSSRLMPFKRVDLAIDAFAALAERLPPWDLVILGDGPERSALEARVPAALRDRVKFTGFIGRQETVTAVYRASHVLVHPSEHEPWALVINEAAAAGLAIVSSDVVGAAAELVRDGVNGRIVPVGRLDELISALAEVTRPDRLASMRAESPRVLAEWRRVADPVTGLRTALAAVGALPARKS
jgi:glycosyltransferase involved in cell wall biosynthesis